MAEGLRVRDEDDRPAGLVRRPHGPAAARRPGRRARGRSGAWTCRPWSVWRLPAGHLRRRARAARRLRPPSRSRRCALWRCCETAIATAAPAAATTSVARETHIQSPGYQPMRAIHRRRSRSEPPGDDGQRVAALEAVVLVDGARRAAARAGSVGGCDREPAVAGRRRRHGFGAGSITVCSPAGLESDRPQFGQKLDRRRIGAPHWQRATLCAPCRSSSISPSRASMPTTIAARSCEQVVAEPAAAVHLDEQPAEVAQRVLARLEQRPALAAQHTGVRPARGDPGSSVGAAAEATSARV